MVATKTRWHSVQCTRTGFYYVTRYTPGKSEDDAEFLPMRFATGEQADKAADKAQNPWKY